ncbi:hypothetical protein [Neisseria musculi]|uniref:hypothetical protein n=1 Tax=Neisseria musculi TaxID=1815583 RepID=UPI00164B0D99|nr:hypothetical protein [Neisseria musculi]
MERLVSQKEISFRCRTEADCRLGNKSLSHEFLWKMPAPANSFAQNIYGDLFYFYRYGFYYADILPLILKLTLLQLWGVLPFRFARCLQRLLFLLCLLCFQPNFTGGIQNLHHNKQGRFLESVCDETIKLANPVWIFN